MKLIKLSQACLALAFIGIVSLVSAQDYRIRDQMRSTDSYTTDRHYNHEYRRGDREIKRNDRRYRDDRRYYNHNNRYYNHHNGGRTHNFMRDGLRN